MKTFNTVDHEVLIKHLHDLVGIRKIPLNWFHSFLAGRFHKVVIGER